MCPRILGRGMGVPTSPEELTTFLFYVFFLQKSIEKCIPLQRNPPRRQINPIRYLSVFMRISKIDPSCHCPENCALLHTPASRLRYCTLRVTRLSAGCPHSASNGDSVRSSGGSRDAVPSSTSTPATPATAATGEHTASQGYQEYHQSKHCSPTTPPRRNPPQQDASQSRTRRGIPRHPTAVGILHSGTRSRSRADCQSRNPGCRSRNAYRTGRAKAEGWRVLSARGTGGHRRR